MKINEELAERAKEDGKLKLEQFDEFLGLGVVQVNTKSKDMAIAVYVSQPRRKLSDLFRKSIPAVVEVQDHGRTYSVPTKIVNLGRFSL